MCKKYRVYFSTPEGVKPGMDYLVDHSIYFYLMGECFFYLHVIFIWGAGWSWGLMLMSTDPDGDFVEAIGRQHSPEAASRIIREHMGDWRGGVKKI